MSREQVMAYAEAAERRLSYVPGQLLVKFKAGSGPEGRERALAIMEAPPNTDAIEWIGDIALLKNVGPIDPLALAQQLNSQSDILWAEPNYLLRPQLTPNDPSYASRQWNFQSINLPRAWDITPGGSSNVIVAIVDTGITTFPAQNVNVSTWNGSAIVPYAMPAGMSPDFDTSRFVNPRDFTISLTSPPSIVVDTDGHGSHVAGTVGENTGNGVNLSGVAYRSSIMPLKACVSFWDGQFARSAAGLPGFFTQTTTLCSSAATAAAVRYAADNGAKVINYSLGSNSGSQTIHDALSYAVSKGVFIAISNGNDHDDGDPAGYPAAYAPDFSGVMSVAATGQAEKRASYSTIGSYTEIAAPGGDSAQGGVIWQMSIRSSDASIFLTFPRFDRYDERGFSGTSMASPHVAGIAALIVARQAELGRTITPAQIESILRQSAKDLGNVGKDNEFGYGLVQPFAALFGQGIIR
jgi:serine protease